MMKNLFIFAHPNISNSKINKCLKETILNNLKDFDGEVLDLHEEYPDFNINFKKEKERALSSENIIFLFPIHWYSMTPMLKQYMDIVFVKGFAYGDQFSLEGKGWAALTSSGKTKEAYGEMGHSLEELMKFFELSMSYIKMEKLGWINNYGAKEEKLKNSLEQLKNILNI